MADNAYKPALLAGAKGFEKYTPKISVNREGLATTAPSFNTTWEWPSYGLEESWLSLARPGYSQSLYPSQAQYGYTQFVKTPTGMGVYATMPTMDPSKLMSYDPERKQLRLFSTDLSVIDPRSSIENATGEFLGLQPALVGVGGAWDPFTYLNERDFRMDNYPSRLLDYAYSLPMEWMTHLMGINAAAPSTPRNEDGSGFMPFENNWLFWESMRNWQGSGRPPTDEELLAEAREEASQVTMQPQMLVPVLFERFKLDRSIAAGEVGITSGNERVDYLAKKEVETLLDMAKYWGKDPMALVAQFGGATNQVARSLLTMVPGIGTPLAEWLMPASAEAEALWEKLSPSQRVSILDDAAKTAMLTDVWATLPLLSGAGALASALKAGAKGGEFMSWAMRTGMVKPGAANVWTGWTPGRALMNVAKEGIYELAGAAPTATRGAIGAFGTTLWAMDKAMAYGWLAMGTNWALESFVPGYAEEVGYDIDRSRPFSESQAAGLINMTGYFSSATGGLYTAFRTTKALPRLPGRVIGGTGILGQEEVTGFAFHFGGMNTVAKMRTYAKSADGVSPGYTEPALTTPIKAAIFSELGEEVIQLEVQRVTREIMENPAFAGLDVAARTQMANDAIHNALQSLHHRQSQLASLLQAVRDTRSPIGEMFLTDAQRVTQNTLAKVGREIEDRMASRLAEAYGDPFWQRQFRLEKIPFDETNLPGAYRAWMRKTVERQGLVWDDAAATKANGNDVTAWRQAANTLRANDFYAENAKVIEAAKVSPADLIEAHPEDYFLMRADHLFKDRADYYKSAIESLKTDSPMVPEAMLRQEIAADIRSLKELDEWWARLKDKPTNPSEISLDDLLAYIDDAYSVLPGRHPFNVTDPLTANFPINAIARRLHAEGRYAVAYKPKGDIIAYRPVSEELAVRVSQNPPINYVLTPAADLSTSMPPGAATGFYTVTTDVPAIRAQGLKARKELAEEVGEKITMHGTGNASQRWYVYDPAFDSGTNLAGKGLYTTDSPSLVGSYARYGGEVKEFRIASDARIFDTEVPIPDEVMDALVADMAKGPAGRFGEWSRKAAASEGNTPAFGDQMVMPGGGWYEPLQSLAIPAPTAGGGAATRMAYYDAVIDDALKLGSNYEQSAFKNAVNEILQEAGWDGLTHTGGRRMQTGVPHKVTVLFDPENMMQRAKVVGTGLGGDIMDHGNLVSMYTNPERAAVAQERLTLAVRASRGEATVGEIVEHFERAVAWTGADDWTSFITAIEDRGYTIPTRTDRNGFLTALDFYYKPTPENPAKLGELVLDLNRTLRESGFPTDGAGAYDPAGWGYWIVNITTPPARLAKIDPANIGTVRVAMRTENPVVPDGAARLTHADLLTLDGGAWDKVMATTRRDEWGYRMVGSDEELQRLITEGVDPQHSLMFQSATDLNEAFPFPKFLGNGGILRVRNEDALIEHRIPSQALEVLAADGTWRRLGALDRLPNEPVPGEAWDAWTGRLWQKILETGNPVDETGIGNAFLQVEESKWREAQLFGSMDPDPWNAVIVKSFDDIMGNPLDQYHNMVLLEADRDALDIFEHVISTGGRNFGAQTQWELRSMPSTAVKRVWAPDPNTGKYVLVKEVGRYGLGPEDFYVRDPVEAAVVKSRSNHLWTVDPGARAKWAGWRDTTQQPLDNQWAQPWGGLIEDPSAGATPVYTHVSYVRLRDGTLLKAPWKDYPMNPGDIYLGNRTALGRKYDSIFQGVRSWKMNEYHLSQMARVFGGRYGYTAAQIELFKSKVEALARNKEYGPEWLGGWGKVRITPYANARLRAEEVNRIGRSVFGEGEVMNLVTGAMETPDFARLFTDTHMQAWTLNFTSGITSRIKQFDLLSIGPISTAIADWVIPVLRFKVSAVFRFSELAESKIFNNMRGVNVSKEERAIFEEAGLTPNSNLLGSDFGTDPLIESMFTTSQSQAARQFTGINGLDDFAAGEGTTGVAASYAIWRDVDDLFSKKGVRGLLDDMKDPARYKNGQMIDMQVEIIKRELPLIIKNRDPEAYRILSDVMHVPDSQMARFLAEDRIIYGRWQQGRASFEDLLRHGQKFTKDTTGPSGPRQWSVLGGGDREMAAIYATEDWQVLDTLMRVAAMSAQSEAFGVHYFGSYRSALERSINHPLLGIYPASWAYKAAKEWVRFLYDNRTFGNGQLRLGMWPAVAMNTLVNQINRSVAMTSEEPLTPEGGRDTWKDWLDNGPARNWLFLWNLILPGDWSSLPLPVARPIRSITRAIQAGDWNALAPWSLASDTIMGPQGRGGIGLIRDLNLAVRGLADLYNYATKDEPGTADNLAKGLSLDGQQVSPVNWNDLVEYPDPVNLTGQ